MASIHDFLAKCFCNKLILVGREKLDIDSDQCLEPASATIFLENLSENQTFATLLLAHGAGAAMDSAFMGAISKRLAKLMNGEVGVNSQSGIGSTFWLSVRLAKATEAISPAPTSTSDSA